ncbi:MAG TPA: thiamine pyrophosphate-requiring protein [Chloroflexota bacterium]|nr:thiamine pyrophosphate-requiring protein [Chloroflexota bacterium]
MARAETIKGTDERWGEYGADNYADALIGSMKLGGIDHLFFNSGTEIGFYQESIAKAEERGWPTPRLLTVPHEAAALNAALGVSMVTGQPSATAVHVDVGLQNFGGAIHTAIRGSYPVLIMSGAAPRAYPESMPGGRNSDIHWVQEPRDQGEIVRQYTKVDHRLEYQDNPGLIVSRLLQVAMSEPKGPVYMAVPREVALIPLPGMARFPTRDDLGVARATWPDPADARTVAQWLIHADNPGIYVGRSGRNPRSVEALVRLAELLALPVMERAADRLNFPRTHPLFGTGPLPTEADVLLIIESLTAYAPPDLPPPTAKIARVSIDPVYSQHKTIEYRADMWLPVDAGAAAQAIYDAATSMLTKSDMGRIADRRARLEQRKAAIEAECEESALRAGQRKPLHPRWVAYQLGKILEPDAVLLDDSLSNGVHVQAFNKRSQPGTYFKSGGSSGGWGAGAAFGAKLGRPDRDVVLASGDGFFMYGSPIEAMWSAEHYKAPFLSLVFVNRSYSTGTRGVKTTFPDGTIVRTKNFEGGVFDPPPDFAKMAEAANCYGETVREPEEVGPALQRALEQTRKGTPALVAAWLPTLVEEMEREA